MVDTSSPAPLFAGLSPPHSAPSVVRAAPRRPELRAQWRSSVSRLIPDVEVLRPRSEIPRSAFPELPHATLANLSALVRGSFDASWEQRGRASALQSPVFITDVDERRDFTAALRGLLGELTGASNSLPERNATLITGPVGCGKSTLSDLFALAVAALFRNALFIRFECAGQADSVFFSEIIAAGLQKSGLVSPDEVAECEWFLPSLRALAKTKKLHVVLFVDETQRLFGSPNHAVHRSTGVTWRSKELENEVNYLESKWPRTFLSGSASSLTNLFYLPHLVSPQLFPSKMMRPVNGSKFTVVSMSRLRSSGSVAPIVADLEREFQLFRRVNAEVGLERDADGTPLAASESNRRWLEAAIDDLSDRGKECTVEESNRTRATAYLRRFLWDGVEDDQLIFFLALLYSRGIPRELKALRGRVDPAVSSIYSLFPERVRALWMQMASFLLRQPDPKLQDSLEHAVRDLGSLSYRTQYLSDVLQSEDLSVLQINIDELCATIPGVVIPDVATLTDWVDRGYLLWDHVHNRISFASVADFALTRLSAAMEVHHLHLLALLFNECGKEHERIAVLSIRDAAKSRFHEPSVRNALACLGLVRAGKSPPWITVRDGIESMDIHTLMGDCPVTFPPIGDFKRSLLSRGAIPTLKKSKRSKTTPGSEAEDIFRSKLSTSDVLARAAEEECDVVMSKSITQAPKDGRSAARASLEKLTSSRTKFNAVGKKSLLFHFATTRSDAVKRSVHEALGIDPALRSQPVILKPHPDEFRFDWILVNPDESVSVIQMKHGGSPIDERATTVAVAAGAKVLRAWLGHRGVSRWATLPIRPVVWCVRPTTESQWVAKDPSFVTGSIAAAVGVEWLDRTAIAPLWPADVVQILFYWNKQGLWGVECEKERAKVAISSRLSLAKALESSASKAPLTLVKAAVGDADSQTDTHVERDGEIGTPSSVESIIRHELGLDSER